MKKTAVPIKKTLKRFFIKIIFAALPEAAGQEFDFADPDPAVVVLAPAAAEAAAY